jgi:hypothetical protein
MHQTNTETLLSFTTPVNLKFKIHLETHKYPKIPISTVKFETHKYSNSSAILR